MPVPLRAYRVLASNGVDKRIIRDVEIANCPLLAEINDPDILLLVPELLTALALTDAVNKPTKLSCPVDP